MIAYSTRAPGNDHFLHIIVMIMMMRTKPKSDCIFNQGHCHTVISDLAQDLNISLRTLSRKKLHIFLIFSKLLVQKYGSKLFKVSLKDCESTNLRFLRSVQVFIPFLPSRLFQLENCLCRLTTLHSSLSTAI